MNKLQLTFLKIWSRCILHSFSSKDALSESPCNIWASKLWFSMAFCSSSAWYSSFSLEEKNPQINMSDFTFAFEKKRRNQHYHFRIMWGLRFTQQHPWRFKSFGMSNCITWKIVTDILEICAASFFRVWKSSKCSWNMQAAHFSEMVVIPPWTYDMTSQVTWIFPSQQPCDATWRAPAAHNKNVVSIKKKQNFQNIKFNWTK